MKVFINSFMRLLETILLEDRIDFIAQNQGDAVWKAYNEDRDSNRYMGKVDDPKHLIAHIASRMPTTKHLQWFINMYIKGEWMLEDIGPLVDTLKAFEEHRKNLTKKDLMQYKTVTEFRQAVRLAVAEKKESEKMTKEEYDTKSKWLVDVGYADKYVKQGTTLIVPKTQEASCHFGMETEWCTAHPKDDYNYFDEYYEDGFLYIFINSDGSKYQLQTESDQFMDSDDRDIMEEWVGENRLKKKYPGMAEFVSEIARDAFYLPLLDINGKDREFMLGEIKDDPKLISNFAHQKYSKFIIDAVEANPEAFKHIPEHLRTYRVSKVAIEAAPFNIKYADDVVISSDDFIRLAVLAYKGNKRTFERLPDLYKFHVSSIIDKEKKGD
jgi:hypothetical protein